MTNSANDANSTAIEAWFSSRLPQAWVAPQVAAPRITVDREEITVVITRPDPETAPDSDPATQAEAAAGAVARFRSETREQRIGIAREAEHRFGRKVAWGVQLGERTELFTHLAVPVMTRLRQQERQVLDTLVEAGVARSRAHALVWCVRLVGSNAEQWLGDLRAAMSHVQDVRAAGPHTAADASVQDASVQDAEE